MVTMILGMIGSTKKLSATVLCLLLMTKFGCAEDNQHIASELSLLWPWVILCGIAIAGWVVASYILFYRWKTIGQAQRINVAKLKYEKAIRGFEQVLEAAESQLLLWDDPKQKPASFGHLPTISSSTSFQFLQFASWLTERSAAEIEQSVNELLYQGTGFDVIIKAQSGQFISVTGRINAGQAIALFQNATNMQRENAIQRNNAILVSTKIDMISSLFNIFPQPFWLRNENGRIIWSNAAYKAAANALSQTEVDETAELFNQTINSELAASPAVCGKEVFTNVHGDRKHFLISHIAEDRGSAGIALDITVVDNLRNEVLRLNQGYSETLDLLATAVAVFDGNMKLIFYNQAFISLWPIETAFLETHPSHALILDRLREQERIAEQPDWRQWKEDLFSAYRTLETTQQIWNLPDGRTLRVFAYPHPQGGVTWLFENLTEKIDLETRFNTLIKMQGETLDHLSEGVVVFGTDGRVRLSNPAFIELWGLPHELAVEGTHIKKIENFCQPLVVEETWSDLLSSVTGFNDQRDAVHGRMDLKEGKTLDFSLVPLPEGQTMLTFVDVTANVNYARALYEKNEALEAADTIRTDFVKHVSYELRTPLTNIIGFTDLMRTPNFGHLNERQLEYINYIGSESVKLLNIVNDILDLATVDAGIMDLDISKVNTLEVVAAAIARIENDTIAKDVRVRTKFVEPLPDFYADSGRLRQVLINILTNAANFAPSGSTISFDLYTHNKSMVFSVHDEGCGIPESIMSSVFKPFSSHGHHGASGGAGLGLSIVKSFVELHGGVVQVETSEKTGTTITCQFPLIPPKASRFQNNEPQ